jgi:hypothetical protein
VTLAVLNLATEEPTAELGMHALDGCSEVKSVFISTEG